MIQLYRDPHYIDKFTIYGERHSGTNFLEQCIKQKFGLDITYQFGFKHWFGFCKPEKIRYNRQILFIGIVRNPYNWLTAFYDAPHHVPKHSRNRFEDFLTNEWYSVNYQQQEIVEDRNYATRFPHTRYKNIFELRQQKCIYLSQIMPLIAKNYVLLSYDSFLKNHNNFLKIIGNSFDLRVVGNAPEVINKRSLEILPNIKQIIDDNLDWTVEESLGYFRR